MRLSRKTVATFEAISAQSLEFAEGKAIDYRAVEPKHHFLEYLVTTKGMAFHGSNHRNLATLRPNTATGIHSDQALTAVYATTDSLMALFFAIIDRPRVRRFSTRSTPYQFFVDEHSLAKRPWVAGTVYIVRRDQFEGTPSGNLVSYQDVLPIATLAVMPTDFPFLDRVQGY